jgi:hypothetical protein
VAEWRSGQGTMEGLSAPGLLLISMLPVGMDGGREGGGVGRCLSTVFLQTLNSDSNVSEPPTGDQTR